MTYNEIYRPITRTSFSSKMKHAFYASIETMSPQGQVEPNVLRTKYLPDEIETFVLNSVVANEYSEQNMTEKQFTEIMDAIRAFQPPEYYEKQNTDRLKWILPTIGAVQFESQEYLLFKLYRHHFLFSFVDNNANIGEEFTAKFGRSFDDYAAFIYILHMLLAKKEVDVFWRFLSEIHTKNSWFTDNLSLTRKQYIDELSQFAKDKNDYRFCLRPSYSYPLIEYKGTLYLPTPHLLVQSITSAMMNRLTFNNPMLREKIGKNACERYLYIIVNDSGLFDEVIPEFIYGNGQRTIDIMARKNDTALLIESKLFSPKTSLRTFNEEDYEKDIERTVKSIKQAFIHGHNKFRHEYNPFSSDINDVYVLVVTYQEALIDLDEIYKETARALSIDSSSEEFDWLWQHVGYTDGANFGRFMLTKTDIFPQLFGRKAISDRWLTGNNRAELTDELRHYRDVLINNAQKRIIELQNG